MKLSVLGKISQQIQVVTEDKKHIITMTTYAYFCFFFNVLSSTSVAAKLLKIKLTFLPLVLSGYIEAI